MSLFHLFKLSVECNPTSNRNATRCRSYAKAVTFKAHVRESLALCRIPSKCVTEDRVRLGTDRKRATVERGLARRKYCYIAETGYITEEETTGNDG